MEKTIKILICDESADERKKIADYLTKNGARKPDEADNGECALKMLRAMNQYLVAKAHGKRIAVDTTTKATHDI